MTYGSYDTEVEEVEDMGEVDLVMFMGKATWQDAERRRTVWFVKADTAMNSAR